MSELKEYIGPTPDEKGLADYYLKSEADKEIQRLENLCESYRIDCDNLAISEANAYKEIGRCNKQIRHNKYKRCIDNAKLCNEKWLVHNFEEIPTKLGFYDKWHKRWLELAEKFKEAK